MPADRVALDEAQFNTGGYVVSRYGAMSGQDLAILTHGEVPWRLADADRPSGGEVRIRAEIPGSADGRGTWWSARTGSNQSSGLSSATISPY